MCSAVIEKVQRLIALASSDNANEARNAAVTACRLIREHRLVVSETQARRTSRVRDSYPFTPRQPSSPFDDIWDYLNQEVAAGRRHTTASRVCGICGRRIPYFETSEMEAGYHFHVACWQQPTLTVMNDRDTLQCHGCSLNIEQGERIVTLARTRQVWHLLCYPRELGEVRNA